MSPAIVSAGRLIRRHVDGSKPDGETDSCITRPRDRVPIKANRPHI